MPWFTSGYPRGGSIPSGSSWCEYRGGLRHATDLHNGLHGANHSAADPRLRPLRVGAGRMKPGKLASTSLRRPGALGVGGFGCRAYERACRRVDLLDRTMRSVAKRDHAAFLETPGAVLSEALKSAPVSSQSRPRKCARKPKHDRRRQQGAQDGLSEEG